MVVEPTDGRPYRGLGSGGRQLLGTSVIHVGKPIVEEQDAYVSAVLADGSLNANGTDHDRVGMMASGLTSQ